jgi:hypothetical protein
MDCAIKKRRSAISYILPIDLKKSTPLLISQVDQPQFYKQKPRGIALVCSGDPAAEPRGIWGLSAVVKEANRAQYSMLTHHYLKLYNYCRLYTTHHITTKTIMLEHTERKHLSIDLQLHETKLRRSGQCRARQLLSLRGIG